MPVTLLILVGIFESNTNDVFGLLSIFSLIPAFFIAENLFHINMDAVIYNDQTFFMLAIMAGILYSLVSCLIIKFVQKIFRF